MRTMLACMALFATLIGSTGAEPRYDRKLEAAVKANIAKSIGDIRSGFEPGQSPEFVGGGNSLPTGSVKDDASAAGMSRAAPESRGTLSLATERKPSRRTF